LKEEGIQIFPIQRVDRLWINEISKMTWGSRVIVSRGKVYDLNSLDGFIASIDNRKIGFIIYNVENDQWEIMALLTIIDNVGIGTKLVKYIEKFALEKQCRRIWLIATNDNVDALRFYQKKGYTIKIIHAGAIEQSRKLKPEIPLEGNHGIIVRDEIELEKFL
jgi:GNAT superfamily N-acetyltransferase